MVKKETKKNESKNKTGCLFYFWILLIIIGVITSQIRNEPFFSVEYIVTFVVMPPIFYYICIKEGWLMWW